MTADSEFALLKRLPLLPPALIRKRAEMLRRQSVECAQLAADCLTEDAKQVLRNRAEELGGEADELDGALRTIRRLYSEAFESDPGVPADG